MAIHARLRDALAELVNDLLGDNLEIELKDYGFNHFLKDTPQGQLTEAMQEVIAQVSRGTATIVGVSMAMIAAPRTGLYYFKLGPTHGSSITELMPPVYFSISSDEVLLHEEATQEQVNERLAEKEGFEQYVSHITAGERYAVRVQAGLLEKVRTLITVALQKEYGHGLTYRLEAAARIVGITDYHQLDRHLDELDLPTLCAVLTALGAEDELDYI